MKPTRALCLAAVFHLGCHQYGVTDAARYSKVAAFIDSDAMDPFYKSFAKTLLAQLARVEPRSRFLNSIDKEMKRCGFDRFLLIELLSDERIGENDSQGATLAFGPRTFRYYSSICIYGFGDDIRAVVIGDLARPRDPVIQSEPGKLWQEELDREKVSQFGRHFEGFAETVRRYFESGILFDSFPLNLHGNLFLVSGKGWKSRDTFEFLVLTPDLDLEEPTRPDPIRPDLVEKASSFVGRTRGLFKVLQWFVEFPKEIRSQ